MSLLFGWDVKVVVLYIIGIELFLFGIVVLELDIDVFVFVYVCNFIGVMNECWVCYLGIELGVGLLEWFCVVIS